MSDHRDDSARPAKRARLDDNSAPTLSADTSAPAPQAATIAPIDTDLEREVRAGITEHVCPDNLGFTGVLKQRYTDFLVNEIGLDGQVLHLKSTNVPRKEEKKVNGRQKNGVEAAAAQIGDGKLVVKEETGDVAMVDAPNGEAAEQNMEIKTEETPAKEVTVVKQEDEQEAEVKQEEEKPEPEVEVGLPIEPQMTTTDWTSLLKKTATH